MVEEELKMSNYTATIQFRPTWMGRKNRWVAFVSYWNGVAYAPYCHAGFPSQKAANRFALGYTG
jgi:hypothetical protein